jgi:hypothetical protein
MRAEHTFWVALYNGVRLICVCLSLSYQLNDVTADIVCNHPVCIRGMRKQKLHLNILRVKFTNIRNL